MEITVERVRHALVVGRLDADGAAVLLAANLPPKRDRTFVVVGASSVDAMRRLDPWVVADLADEVRGDLCVVAPGFGSMGADGTLPPARLLADRLGVEVTAADGDPVGLADGTVFVPGPAAGWVSYRPGGRRTRVGARFPAPWWQDGLPEEDDHLTHVPVGLWLRRPDGPARPGDPLLRQVPDRDRMYVVLGAPGEEPPDEATVTDVLRALPDEARDRAVLAWYGSASRPGTIADRLGAPVRVAHGVPGDSGLVHVDEHGAARWRPFAVESVYRPGGAPPVLDRWIAPPRLAMVEPGSFRLVPGWRVDVVARGLVVRPETVRPDPAVLTMLAAETGPTADVVFAVDGPVPGDVLPAVDRLVRELPADTRAALRILPADEAAAAALTGIEAAAHVAAALALPDAPVADEAVRPTGTVIVTADGRILPAEPILAVPAPRVPFVAPAVAAPEPPAPTAGLDIQNGVLVVAEEEVEETFAAVAPEHARADVADDREAATEFVASGGLDVVPAPEGEDRVEPAGFAASGEPDEDDAETLVAGFAAAIGPVLDATAVLDEPVFTSSTEAATPGTADEGVDQPVVPRVEAPVVVSDDRPAEVTVDSSGIPSVAAATAVPAIVPAAVPATEAAPAPEATPEPAPLEPVASVVGLLPGREIPRSVGTAAAIEVPENVRSTVTQRRAMRAKLGSRYDVATRAVTRLLSERPGLRFGAGDHAALLAELAVVRVFADDPAGDYDADFYVCLADGLRRLPTARAVVVRGIPADTDLRPGSVVRLPTPLVAAPVTAPEPVGPAEALIWTTTARRLDGLLDEPHAEPRDEGDDKEVPRRGTDVVLSGHTRLRVLAVAPTPVRRVLLAEDGAASDAALTRLLAAAAARQETVDTVDTSRWFGALPAAG